MRKFIIFLVLILILLFLASITIAFFCWRGIYLPKDASSPAEKIFMIEKGDGIIEISSNLEKEGIIRRSFLFQLYTFSKGVAGKLQAGQYSLSSSMTIPEIADKIVSGQTIEDKITIIEGWNLRDIAYHLEGRGMFQPEEFFELVGFPVINYSVTNIPKPRDFSDEFSFLKDKPKNLGLEGYLFPDTYYFRKQTTETNQEKLEEIVRKALVNFDKKVTVQLREEIKRQGKSIFEIAIMASLIEKEVQTLEDKKLVSGVLWKRFNADMPLQVDATIIYLTAKKTTKISIEETKIDSSYNTYKYRGLPLGPICNPGLESIKAVVYSEDSEYWFYLSTPEGETIFSKSLEEHNIAINKYLK